MNRRDFMIGLFSGIAAVAGITGGIKAVRGEFHSWISPLGVAGMRNLDNPEMEVILLGTGNPLSNRVRSKPAQVVLAGGKAFLVDCGGGTVERLLCSGLEPGLIDDVFITHHHSDHNSGLINLFISRASGGQLPGANTPLRIYGPSNSKLLINKLMDHLQWDIDLRIRQAHNDPDGSKLTIYEKDDGLVYDKDGLKVTTFLVDHGIVKPSVGYTFEYGGKKIVFSGDTRPCEAMVEHAQNADVLIHEAYSQKWIDIGLKKYPEKAATAEGIKKYHSSVIEVATIAQRARVKHLVYTHLMPSPTPIWYFERSWAAGASDVFNGKISVGRDLDCF